jgi:hypothetical protein
MALHPGTAYQRCPGWVDATFVLSLGRKPFDDDAIHSV